MLGETKSGKVSNWKRLIAMAYNTIIYAMEDKKLKGTALGLWYQQIPNGYVVNPLGEVVEPKEHNGSKFVLRERKRFAVSKLTKLDYKAAMEFKKIFC